LHERGGGVSLGDFAANAEYIINETRPPEIRMLIMLVSAAGIVVLLNATQHGRMMTPAKSAAPIYYKYRRPSEPVVLQPVKSSKIK
jgi:hypothetical protein